ncbi:MAG TPA: hypothetical protein VFO25_08225 [Candidatus Eremiobacteraceae bacterium]|nr:hypothetical protein [Candidatus Eremiobacteraceae bacterium]
MQVPTMAALACLARRPKFVNPATDAEPRLSWLVKFASSALVLMSVVGCSKSLDTGPFGSPPPQAYVGATSFRAAYTAAPSGSLSRTLYKTDSGLGYTVEIREVIVPPKRSLAIASLPGGVVVENLTGSGFEGSAGAKLVQASGVAPFAAGEPLSLKNAGGRSAELRVFVFAPSSVPK